MSTTGLTSGAEFLREAAKKYFKHAFENPTLVISGELDPALNWKPTIHFEHTDHLVVVAEVSETPYPIIFGMRHDDVINLEMPISVYCVCPEEAYLSDQAEAKRLMANGYGLLTVSADGKVQKRSDCIPLIQRIAESHFKSEIRGLSTKIRRKLRGAYTKYNNSAASGVAEITEIAEAFVLKAGRDAVSKGWISASDAKPGNPAGTLAAMADAKQCKNAAAAIAGMQHYISAYRHTAHHPPKNKKQEYKKYRDCRHAFLDGIKIIHSFREAMKSLKLSGSI